MTGVAFPEYCELVGFGLALGGFLALLPTPVGAPVALSLGIVTFLTGRWLA